MPTPLERKQEISALLKLGVPIALTQLAQISMQLIDVALVGRISPEQMGGLSVGSAFFTFFMIGGIGLLLGLDFLMSHAFGAKKQEDVNLYLVQALYLSFFLALPFVIITWLFAPHFSLLGIAPEVAIHAEKFLKAVSGCFFPVFAFTALRQYLQSMGVALPSLLIMIIANVFNALAAWVLVFGKWGFPPLGAEGAGWATTFARILMFILILGYVAVHSRKNNLKLSSTAYRISLPKIFEVIRIGAPAGIQVLLEVGAFASSTILAGRLGAIPLSAHQIVLQIASFTFMFPLGIGSAASVRIAQNLGASRNKFASYTGWASLVLGMSIMACFGVLIAFFGETCMAIFTNDQQVIQLGASLLMIAAFFQVFDGAQTVGSGVLRGVGNTRASMLANLIGHWIIGLPSGIILCFTFQRGVWGMWIGLSLGLIFVAISLIWIWHLRSKSLRQ